MLLQVYKKDIFKIIKIKTRNTSSTIKFPDGWVNIHFGFTSGNLDDLPAIG
jgi:hypothetical protein